MGIETFLLAGSALSSIVGGVQQMGAANEQATAAQVSAEMAGQETARVAAKEARLEREKTESHARAQKVAALKSGVSLQGSPLLMMEKTRLTGQSNIDEIIQSGASTAATQYTEGRTMARNYKQSGRQAFMSGLTGAAKSMGSLYGY